MHDSIDFDLTMKMNYFLLTEWFKSAKMLQQLIQFNYDKRKLPNEFPII